MSKENISVPQRIYEMEDILDQAMQKMDALEEKMTEFEAFQPEIHRGCKLAEMFRSGEARTDRVIPDRVRGWMPVQGYPDLCVHFAVMIPEE